MDFNPARNNLDRFLDFIAETRWVWALGILAVALGFVFGLIKIPNLTLGPNLQVMLVTGIFSTVIFIIPAKRLVERFYTPDYELLLVTNAQRDDPTHGWSIGHEKMKELDIKPKEKNVYSTRGENGLIKNYLREFDAEEMEGLVNWHGMKEEAELMETQQKIKNIRVERRQTLQKAMTIMSDIDTIIEDIAVAFYQEESFNITEFAGKAEGRVYDVIEDHIGTEEEENENNTAEDLIEELEEADQVVQNAESQG